MQGLDFQTIRVWLEHTAAPQMLMDEHKLLAFSSEAKRYLPSLKEGETLEVLFGKEAEDLRTAAREERALLSLTLGGCLMSIRISSFQGYILAELLPDGTGLSGSALLTIADSLLTPMASLMALSSKLLPLLPETEGNLNKAAMFNKSLYSLLRASRNIQSAGNLGKRIAARQPMDLISWVQSFTEELLPLCQMAGRKFTLQVPEGLLITEADPDLMRRCVLNLLSNAIKYTEEGGEIILSLKKLASGRIRMTMQDDGVGMTEDQLAHIYDRREHRKLIPDPREGNGFGLAVVRDIVRAHGGTLLIESSPGQGTKVHITMDGRKDLLLVRSDTKLPSSTGYSDLLVELADVLPYQAFDTRGID